MTNQVKSGKEILDDFFNEIENIENVEPKIAQLISLLFNVDKLTDINVKNGLQNLRTEDERKD